MIGQTPRPDLTTELRSRVPAARFRVVGALDYVQPEEIPACETGGYPLETRLRDGLRVVVDAGFVAPFLQDGIERHADGARAHLILCAGPFHDLIPPMSPSEEPTPLIRPFEEAARRLLEEGYRRLDLLVPFAGQATPAREKWAAAGFSCRAHVITDRPSEGTLADWVSKRVGEGDAEALVFDYVGFPSATFRQVSARIEIPAFDVGDLALHALEKVLDAS